MKKIMAFPVVLIAALNLLAQENQAQRFEKVVKAMIEAINNANHEGVQKDFSKVMLEAFPLEKSKPFFENLVAQYGKITKLDKPKLTPPDVAVFPAHFEKGKIFDIKVVLDGSDKIAGLWFLPHREIPDIPVPEKHQATLSLPFKEKWFVNWGGDTRELNSHHDVPNQRYAFDFVVTGADGKTFKGEGRNNEDYYAFGKEVLAPADGMVTDVIEGVRDNDPGSLNPYAALGNAVFIRHRDNEVSVLAHFKQGSIKVKVGDKVKKGQVIGLCGNSGNSSQPHLHYHLQNTEVIQDGTGIKVFFDKVLLEQDGKIATKENHSPIKGDYVTAEAK